MLSAAAQLRGQHARCLRVFAGLAGPMSRLCRAHARIERNLMDLIDLLNSDEAELPLVGETDHEAQLRRVFAIYDGEVAKLNANDRATQAVLHARGAITTLGQHVCDALSAWLDGLPEKAVHALDGALNAVAPFVAELSSVPIDATKHGPLFRMRTADLDARLGPRDLFHIPFDLRDRIATQRYSFPGLPCLYFGRSLYVCWEEFGRPALASLWVSKFQLAPSMTLRALDFSHRPAAIAAMLHSNKGKRKCEDIAVAYACLWPLVAACSMKRRPGTSRYFVVEYTLPQLLLRWLIQRQRKPIKNDPIGAIDGIRYFSTCIEDYRVELAGTNYVFPAQTRQVRGICSTLQAKFLMTPPVNWQIATAGNQAPPVPTYNRVTFELSPGWPVDYRFTVFSRVEGFLDGLPMAPMP